MIGIFECQHRHVRTELGLDLVSDLEDAGDNRIVLGGIAEIACQGLVEQGIASRVVGADQNDRHHAVVLRRPLGALRVEKGMRIVAIRRIELGIFEKQQTRHSDCIGGLIRHGPHP